MRATETQPLACPIAHVACRALHLSPLAGRASGAAGVLLLEHEAAVGDLEAA
jgi:hypothetical protein